MADSDAPEPVTSGFNATTLIERPDDRPDNRS